MLPHLSDIFIQSILITFLVIMLMMFIEFVNVRSQGKMIQVLRQYTRFQIIFSALLGLIPGCVGIFVVASLYSHGLLMFGALLAATISTFGDEAFLYFSTKPAQALCLSAILFIIGIVAGFVANLFAKTSNTIINLPTEHIEIHQCDVDNHKHKNHHEHSNKHLLFVRWGILGLIFIFSLGIAFGWIGEDHSFAEMFSLHEHFVLPEHHHDGLSGENIVFILIAVSTFILILLSDDHFLEEHLINHVIKKHFFKIFVWIFGILCLLAIVRHYINTDVLFQYKYSNYILLFVALLIGFIPESGPHLIVFFMFLEGLVPFSTLLANSIMQEGHGGLPLLAEKPQKYLFIKLIKFAIALFVGLSGIWIGY